MNGKQESKFNMYLVTRDFLTANATITASLPNYAGYFTGVTTGITQIHAIREQQEFNKKGITANKTQLRNALIGLTIDVSRKLVAYSTITNNSVLLKEVHYSESVLKKSVDLLLKDKCQVIYDRANANLASLGTYGITATVLTNLLTALNAFTVSIPKPRLGVTDKKLATEQLKNAMKAVEDNLAKIDVLVNIVQTTQANFHLGYTSVRKLITTAHGSLSVKGFVVDKNGERVKGATVTFKAESLVKSSKTAVSAIPMIKETASKGGFQIKSLPDGSYTVTISKPGYNDTIQTVHVSHGELTTVSIVLERK